MPYVYKCRDIGYDCSFEFKAQMEKDLMPRIRIHARYAHNIFEMSPEMEKKVQGSFKEEK
jgi:predicted small metal-binding protein